MKNPISWQTLDRYETADEIAVLLRKAGIKGRRNDSCYCPLAQASGWVITMDRREGLGKEELLTPAEQEFVFLFDDGFYSDLEE